MEMGETLYEWEERAFIFDNGLAGYELNVDVEGPHEHRILGDIPTRVSISVAITDGHDQTHFLTCMESPEERKDAVDVFASLRFGMP